MFGAPHFTAYMHTHTLTTSIVALDGEYLVIGAQGSYQRPMLALIDPSDQSLGLHVATIQG